ncbi:MAG: SMP-30/gluconolactonase/LRE family protein [Pseudomonadota bacterium]|jgi:gluconolactonase|nr:SMP-30/gluconolactonase/LRE family protein [Pseudomonadota bacterium]
MSKDPDRLIERDWNAPIRYPDPAIEVIDSRFRAYVLGSSALERLWTGARWTEGPVWFGDHRRLIWSDIPNDRMLMWDEDTGKVATFRQPANNANGNTRDQQGRLLTCEHGSRRVTRTEHDGTLSILMDTFEGKPLNAPNDIVVARDDSVWFTDPGYGIHWNYEGHRAPFELPTRTYRLDVNSGQATVVDESLNKPNGLAFSPDQSLLYIADTGASHTPGHAHAIHVFDVTNGTTLGNGRVFVDLGTPMPDGFRVDVDGNLWAATGWGGVGHDGVQVFAPDGTKIGAIHLPEGAANLCFGGSKRNRLFITASQSIYSLYVETQGMPY